MGTTLPPRQFSRHSVADRLDEIAGRLERTPDDWEGVLDALSLRNIARMLR